MAQLSWNAQDYAGQRADGMRFRENGFDFCTSIKKKETIAAGNFFCSLLCFESHNLAAFPFLPQSIRQFLKGFRTFQG